MSLNPHRNLCIAHFLNDWISNRKWHLLFFYLKKITTNFVSHLVTSELNQYIQHVKTKRLFFALLLLVSVSSCSLNGEQEASLNAAKMAYLDARNNNKVSMLVRLTYPDAVRYYQNQSDSIFKERFRPENNQEYLQNGSLKTLASKGEMIHVKFEFDGITEDGYDAVMTPKNLFAISLDKGIHWKFLDPEEYNNTKIVPSAKKLIKD